MNYIEILGPAGIGKSTLLDEIRNRRIGKRWLVLNEGVQKIASDKIKVNKARRLLQLFLKQEVYTKKHNVLANLLLSSNQSYFNESLKYEPFMRPLMDYYYNCFDGSSVEKARRICIYKAIIEKLCLFDFYKFSGTIIFDEGPLNHHPLNMSLDSITQNILPKAAIFCRLDITQNLKRIRKREREGRLAVSHKGLTDEELKNLMSVNHNTYRVKRDKILASGKIPYLDIDLGLPVSREPLENFIKDLC